MGLDQELKLIGEYGLRNKREVWRVKYSLALIRSAARELLTLEEKNPRRLFEGNALLRRLVRTGVLSDDRMKLDYVLGLKIEDFLERRLQTQVFKLGLAKSIHHARVLIKQRHILSENRLSMSHHTLSDLTPKNTLTSPSDHHSVAVVQDVSRERTPKRARAAAEMNP